MALPLPCTINTKHSPPKKVKGEKSKVQLLCTNACILLPPNSNDDILSWFPSCSVNCVPVFLLRSVPCLKACNDYAVHRYRSRPKAESFLNPQGLNLTLTEINLTFHLNKVHRQASRLRHLNNIFFIFIYIEFI